MESQLQQYILFTHSISRSRAVQKKIMYWDLLLISKILQQPKLCFHCFQTYGALCNNEHGSNSLSKWKEKMTFLFLKLILLHGFHYVNYKNFGCIENDPCHPPHKEHSRTYFSSILKKSTSTVLCTNTSEKYKVDAKGHQIVQQALCSNTFSWQWSHIELLRNCIMKFMVKNSINGTLLFDHQTSLRPVKFCCHLWTQDQSSPSLVSAMNNMYSHELPIPSLSSVIVVETS